MIIVPMKIVQISQIIAAVKGMICDVQILYDGFIEFD